VVHLSDALDAYLRLRAGTPIANWLWTPSGYSDVIALWVICPLRPTRASTPPSPRFLLTGGNKTATAARRLNSIVAVINKALRNTVWNAVIIRRVGHPERREGLHPRLPFTVPELKQIAPRPRTGRRHQTLWQCNWTPGRELGDHWLTHRGRGIGTRGALCPNPPNEKLGRTLKNAQSERDVPLIGGALWQPKGPGGSEGKQASGGWLFPRYISMGESRRPREGTINKWLRSLRVS